MTNTMEDLHELTTMRASWQALARRWGLTGQELTQLLPERGEDRPHPPPATERGMRLMLALDHRLAFDDDGDARDWLRQPIAEFGHHTPVDLLAFGGAHARELRRFAEWSFGR